MSYRPLISDSEKDKHKTRDQLLYELSELRAQLDTKAEGLASRDRVVGMLDGIAGPILLLDDESRVVYANSAAVKLFAKSPDGIEGKSLWDLYPKSPGTLFHNAYEKARKDRSIGKFRERHRRQGKWFEVCLYPVAGGMTVLFTDITVSRQMEELPALALSLLHNLKDNVFLMRADGRLFHVNNETQYSLGYSSEELHKMSIFDVVPLDFRREWQGVLDRIRQHGSMTFESRLRARDGREFPVEVNASFIELYGSSYYTISARNVTMRKQVEESLRETRDYLESLINFANAPIIVWDPGFTITRFNHAFERLSGYDASEVVGQDLRVLFPADSRDESLDKIGRTLGGEYWESVEIPILRKDGNVRIALWNSANIRNEDDTRLLATIAQGQDITERKLAEEKLRESEASLARSQELAHIGSWELDVMTGKIHRSAESYRIFGLDPEENEVNYEGFLELIAPEDRERVDSIIKSSIETGQPYNITYRIRRKDGEMRILSSVGEAMKDSSGLTVKLYGTNQDITEGKLAEDAVTEAKARAEMYVDLMGHDINNLNQVAMASLEIAIMELEQAGKLEVSDRALLDKSYESLKSSSLLINNVQKLQRASVEGIKLHTVDVADLLNGIIAEQRSTPGKNVTIYYKNHATSCRVTANELLRDVFTNIISNAIKHSGPEKHLTIGVAVEAVEAGGKKFCRVAIEDNGPGIPDGVKARLFQRFSRGDTRAKGTGLGLYLVKTLVEHYGGDISVEDRVPGDHTKGTKFVVTLPSAE